MSTGEEQVFLSYAWGGESESVTNRIDTAMAAENIRVTRDKRDLGFKQSIREFMQRIGDGRAVVVVISDKYLKSKYCMFELITIFRQGRFVDRIFPVLLPDAKIYDALDLLDYVKYWRDKETELEEKMRTIGLANQHGVRDDLDLYDEIGDMIARLVDILRDIITFRPENLNDLIAALVPTVEAGQQTSTEESTQRRPPEPSPGGRTDDELQGLLVDDDPELIAAIGKQLIEEDRLEWAQRFANRLLAISHPNRPDLETVAYENLGLIADRRQ